MQFIWVCLLAWAAGPRPLIVHSSAETPAMAESAHEDSKPSQDGESREAPQPL